jgi:hypothetical protein
VLKYASTHFDLPTKINRLGRKKKLRFSKKVLFLVCLYQLVSNIRIFEVTCRATPYIRKWVFLDTPYFRSYGLFWSFFCTFYIRYSGIALPPNIEYGIWQLLYSILNIVILNIEVRISNIENVLKKEKSILAILSLFVDENLP